jgi:nucleoside-diphosphate-sugar epimerase
MSVMEEWVRRGGAATMVNRSGRIEETLPSTVTVSAGNATDSTQVAHLCRDADVVFHCAQPHYHEWPEKFPPITGGIMHGVEETEARLIFADNLYMYGPTGGEPLTEDLPYAAASDKGRTRAKMARELLQASTNGRVPVAIGRAADFFGPRVLGSAVGDIFFEPAMAGKTVNVLGDPDAPHTYTYIRDFAAALVTLSEHEEALGRAWHVPSAPTVSTRRFANIASEVIGQPVKLRAAGPWTVRLVGLFNQELREFGEIMYMFEEPFVVDHSDFAQAFGDSHTAHRAAIAETVAWFQERAGDVPMPSGNLADAAGSAGR